MEKLPQRLRSPLSEMIGEHAAGAGRGQAEADTLAIFLNGGNEMQLSKRLRATIQMIGAILLVLGVEAIAHEALFRAVFLLPLGGWLFGRSMSA
jgi:hypothetical protein